MSLLLLLQVASVMSDSVRAHRRQPTRLLRSWDSPGKNTGVGCHFLLQCIKVKSESEVVQSCLTQRPHGLQPTRLLCAWESPGNKYARIYQFIRKQKSESCIFIYLLLISSLIPATTNLFFTFLILLFQECHINGMIYYEAFVDWLFTQHTSLEIHPGC